MVAAFGSGTAGLAQSAVPKQTASTAPLVIDVTTTPATVVGQSIGTSPLTIDLSGNSAPVSLTRTLPLVLDLTHPVNIGGSGAGHVVTVATLTIDLTRSAAAPPAGTSYRTVRVDPLVLNVAGNTSAVTPVAMRFTTQPLVVDLTTTKTH